MWSSADDHLRDASNDAYRKLRDALAECARLTPSPITNEGVHRGAESFGSHISILAQEEYIKVKKGGIRA